MSEIRGTMHKVSPLPRTLLPASSVLHVARWLGSGLGRTWQVMEDTDRALLLIPIDGPEPGFVITPVNGEYEVLICDPDDIDELGPFETLSEALSGISHWLALPAADIPGSERAAPDPFRPLFPVPCPLTNAAYPRNGEN